MRVTLIVLGSLLGVFVAFVCLSAFICCCVSKWDKVMELVFKLYALLIP